MTFGFAGLEVSLTPAANGLEHPFYVTVKVVLIGLLNVTECGESDLPLASRVLGCP